MALTKDKSMNTVKELYTKAKQLNIPGRSKMKKDELVKAIAYHESKLATVTIEEVAPIKEKKKMDIKEIRELKGAYHTALFIHAEEWDWKFRDESMKGLGDSMMSHLVSMGIDEKTAREAGLQMVNRAKDEVKEARRDDGFTTPETDFDDEEKKRNAEMGAHHAYTHIQEQKKEDKVFDLDELAKVDNLTYWKGKRIQVLRKMEVLTESSYTIKRKLEIMQRIYDSFNPTRYETKEVVDSPRGFILAHEEALYTSEELKEMAKPRTITVRIPVKGVLRGSWTGCVGIRNELVTLMREAAPGVRHMRTYFGSSEVVAVSLSKKMGNKLKELGYKVKPYTEEEQEKYGDRVSAVTRYSKTYWSSEDWKSSKAQRAHLKELKEKKIPTQVSEWEIYLMDITVKAPQLPKWEEEAIHIGGSTGTRKVSSWSTK
jgi:hypothetical protein